MLPAGVSRKSQPAIRGKGGKRDAFTEQRPTISVHHFPMARLLGRAEARRRSPLQLPRAGSGLSMSYRRSALVGTSWSILAVPAGCFPPGPQRTDQARRRCADRRPPLSCAWPLRRRHRVGRRLAAVDGGASARPPLPAHRHPESSGGADATSAPKDATGQTPKRRRNGTPFPRCHDFGSEGARIVSEGADCEHARATAASGPVQQPILRRRRMPAGRLRRTARRYSCYAYAVPNRQPLMAREGLDSIPRRRYWDRSFASGARTEFGTSP